MSPDPHTAQTAGAPPASLSPEEFAALLDRHSRELWCIAAAILNHAERARDVVQEAAVVGLERRTEFQRGTSFPAWMGQVVRFVALNALRREQIRSPGAPAAVLSGIPAAAPLDHSRPPVTQTGSLRASQTAFSDAVVHALATLDARERAALLLRTVLDLPYDRIAEILSIPQGTAMSHVHRARKRLRDLLAGEDLP